ncbi:MAG: NfeD family protein [Spirochaetaceae bacterium]|nr:NfeD family protein [Spirochaetaceae bacterium]
MDIYKLIASPWFWLFLTILFTIVELLSSFSLTTVWFAVSAAFMIFISALTESLDPSVRFKLHTGLFLAIAAALLVFTRPLAVKKFKVGKLKTNAAALAGSHAVVIKTISAFNNGEIKIKGQIWSAVAEDGSEIAEGSECEVLRIEGVKAIVKKK